MKGWLGRKGPWYTSEPASLLTSPELPQKKEYERELLKRKLIGAFLLFQVQIYTVSSLHFICLYLQGNVCHGVENRECHISFSSFISLSFIYLLGKQNSRLWHHQTDTTVTDWFKWHPTPYDIVHYFWLGPKDSGQK